MVSDLLLQLLHFGGHAITAVATVALAYWVVVHTDLSSKRWFGLWMGNFAVWSVVSAALVVVSLQPLAYSLIVLWVFLGLTAIPLTFFFTIVYTGRNPLTNRLCRVSVVVYVLLAGILFTAPFHTLYWESVSFLRTPFPHVSVEYGFGWLATVLFGIVSICASFYYFAELYFRSRRQQRRAALVLSVGILLGLSTIGFSYLDVFFFVSTYDYYAFSGTTYALFVGYAALRFGSDTLSVVAREEALDHLIDPYIALDTQYQIVDFNDATRGLVDGLSVDRLGDPLAEVVPNVADAVITTAGLELPDEPITFMVDGHPHHYSVAVSTVSDWNSTRGYAIVLNEVTDLERSRHRVEQQNEQLDAFVGTVSHDLRSPLSVIAGRVELARADCDSEHLDHIEQARSRMDELIDDLLTLAREGEAVGDREPVDVGKLIDSCWHTVDTRAATLRVETNRTVLADRSRLRQLLENLLRNSVEHGSTDNRPQAGDSEEHGSTDSRPEADDAVDHGSEDVTITLDSLETGFYIEDDGPGIPEADREDVFETGYTTDDGGTGFGLAIVEGIVDAHGWEITVTEGSEGGARFEITGVDDTASASETADTVAR